MAVSAAWAWASAGPICGGSASRWLATTAANTSCIACITVLLARARGRARRGSPCAAAAARCVVQSLVDQLEVGAVAAPGDLGDLGQHELQILEQALEPRVL